MGKLLISFLFYSIIIVFMFISKKSKLKGVNRVYLKGFSITGKKEWNMVFLYLIIIIFFTLVSILFLDNYEFIILIALFIIFEFTMPWNYCFCELGLIKSVFFPTTGPNLKFFPRINMKEIKQQNSGSKIIIDVIIEEAGKEKELFISVNREYEGRVKEWIEKMKIQS